MLALPVALRATSAPSATRTVRSGDRRSREFFGLNSSSRPPLLPQTRNVFRCRPTRAARRRRALHSRPRLRSRAARPRAARTAARPTPSPPPASPSPRARRTRRAATSITSRSRNRNTSPARRTSSPARTGRRRVSGSSSTRTMASRAGSISANRSSILASRRRRSRKVTVSYVPAFSLALRSRLLIPCPSSDLGTARAIQPTLRRRRTTTDVHLRGSGFALARPRTPRFSLSLPTCGGGRKQCAPDPHTLLSFRNGDPPRLVQIPRTHLYRLPTPFL